MRSPTDTRELLSNSLRLVEGSQLHAREVLSAYERLLEYVRRYHIMVTVINITLSLMAGASGASVLALSRLTQSDSTVRRVGNDLMLGLFPLFCALTSIIFWATRIGIDRQFNRQLESSRLFTVNSGTGDAAVAHDTVAQEDQPLLQPPSV